MRKPTAARVREFLHYDRDTGVFTWIKKPSQGVNVGDRAGSETQGYRNIKFGTVLYREHHLAWVYVYGVWPNRLDHKDLDGTHNWIGNLRECTHGQNSTNRNCRSDSSIGLKGVSPVLGSKTFRVRIQHGHKRIPVSGFGTAQLAHEFYCLAADMLHGEFANHGVHKCANRHA